MGDLERAEPVCWVCAETDGIGKLVHPCRCELGKQGVHEKCLLALRRANCPACLTSYDAHLDALKGRRQRRTLGSLFLCGMLFVSHLISVVYCLTHPRIVFALDLAQTGGVLRETFRP